MITAVFSPEAEADLLGIADFIARENSAAAREWLNSLRQRCQLLAAKAMGYDSCSVIGFMIAVGKAVKPAMPKGGQLALPEVVVQDRFG